MIRYNIVGAGLAGLSAAIALAEQGAASNLISAQPSERAQSVLAEGGINGCLDLMGEGDTVEAHYADTLRGGCDLADPAAVRSMTEAAPGILRWLSALGVPFSRENGQMIQRSFGGQKKKRTAYAKSSTGKILMTALIDEARKYEVRGQIRRFPHHILTDLTVENGVCKGLTVRDDYTGQLWRFSGPVILCTGGMNGLLPGMTTGTTANTGDAAAIALNRGAELANLEFIQYHPTTVAIPGKRLLVSEAARGEGGRLFISRDGKPWYFMEELYPELGNLMPRDVISREMVRVSCREDCEGPVHLDLTGLSAPVWRNRLPDLRKELIQYLALDPAASPIPVSPGIHFFMGGIRVDRSHKTNLKGLWAAGECACQYHGANRLGGNSMLGAIYGGQTAAHSAMSLPCSAGEPEPLGVSNAAPSPSHIQPELCRLLSDGLGIFRDRDGMDAALNKLCQLAPASEAEQRQLLLGKSMILSAIAREESRGAHTRRDFPDRDDSRFQKSTVARMHEDQISITFRSLGEEASW